MTTKRVIGLAAAALGATMILAGAANAAPKLETLPTAGVQKVYYGGGYGGGYYKCFRLPRHVIRMRLRMQGWRHIRNIRYVPNFGYGYGYGYGPKRCSFVATAKRQFGFGIFRLRGSARTGHVFSVRRVYAWY